MNGTSRTGRRARGLLFSMGLATAALLAGCGHAPTPPAAEATPPRPGPAPSDSAAEIRRHADEARDAAAAVTFPAQP